MDQARQCLSVRPGTPSPTDQGNTRMKPNCGTKGLAGPRHDRPMITARLGTRKRSRGFGRRLRRQTRRQAPARQVQGLRTAGIRSTAPPCSKSLSRTRTLSGQNASGSRAQRPVGGSEVQSPKRPHNRAARRNDLRRAGRLGPLIGIPRPG